MDTLAQLIKDGPYNDLCLYEQAEQLYYETFCRVEIGEIGGHNTIFLLGIRHGKTRTSNCSGTATPHNTARQSQAASILL